MYVDLTALKGCHAFRGGSFEDYERVPVERHDTTGLLLEKLPKKK
jgi:hypothetical protein